MTNNIRTNIQFGRYNLAIAEGGPSGTDNENHRTGRRSFFNSRREEIIEKQHYELKELESKYRTLYENAPAMLRTINMEGVILDCNETYVQSLGYSTKSDVIGHSIFEHTPEEFMEGKRKAFDEWRQTGKVKSHETWLRKKDGSAFPVLLNANNLYDAGGNFVGSNTVITDLTEICQARRLKEKATEELKKAYEMKQEFLNIAAHELRTPIQPILGYTELLEKGAINIATMVRGIRESAIRLRELANDILDVTKMESGHLNYSMKRVRASSILRSLVRYADVTIQSYGKAENLVVVAPQRDGPFSEEDSELYVDDERMLQALQNVVNNAIKFTEKGQIKIESAYVRSKGLYQIEISDTGPGIFPEILPRIFDKFVSRSDTEHPAGKSTGLGLYITKMIIQAHEGDIIAFNNEKGTGATFIVRVPVAR